QRGFHQLARDLLCGAAVDLEGQVPAGQPHRQGPARRDPEEVRRHVRVPAEVDLEEALVAKDAIVSSELAAKFATEKDTPYLRWVRGEGLDIIGAHYVQNLRTVELKPWAR